MDVEQAAEQQQNYQKSGPFLAFTFGVGLLIITCLTYLGAKGFSLWLSILVGGVAQVFFRVTKRIWSNSLSRREDSRSNVNPLIIGVIETMPTFKVFGLLYIAMVGVSALWYGIGAFFAWLF